MENLFARVADVAEDSLVFGVGVQGEMVLPEQLLRRRPAGFGVGGIQLHEIECRSEQDQHHVGGLQDTL